MGSADADAVDDTGSGLPLTIALGGVALLVFLLGIVAIYAVSYGF